MKLFHFIKFSALFFAFFVAMAALGKPALAFCIFNETSTPVSVLQLPISESSYKAVVNPRAKDCCNWRQCGGTRYGQSLFVVYTGNHRSGLDSITRERVWEKVEMGVDIVTTVLPGGQAFKVVSVGTKVAKIALKAKKFATQLKKLEKVHRKLNKAKKYKKVRKNIQRAQEKMNKVLADISDKIDPSNLRCDAISAYNGGILEIKNGYNNCQTCWFGSCAGHGVNYDGTVGPQPSLLRGKSNIEKLSNKKVRWDWAGPGYGIPDNLVTVGWEGGNRRGVCMAEHFRGDKVLGIHPGKTVGNRCNYGYGGREYATKNFWALKGTYRKLQWEPSKGGVNRFNIIGGYEPNRKLYVCRGKYRGGTHAGKYWPGAKHCLIGYGGRERWVAPFEALYVGQYTLYEPPRKARPKLMAIPDEDLVSDPMLIKTKDNHCLTIGNQLQMGLRVFAAPCHGKKIQQWVMLGQLFQSYGKIRASNGQCLYASTARRRKGLYLAKCADEKPHQKWQRTGGSNETELLNSKVKGSCLEVTKRKDDIGYRLALSRCNKSVRQKWKYTSTGLSNKPLLGYLHNQSGNICLTRGNVRIKGPVGHRKMAVAEKCKPNKDSHKTFNKFSFEILSTGRFYQLKWQNKLCLTYRRTKLRDRLHKRLLFLKCSKTPNHKSTGEKQRWRLNNYGRIAIHNECLDYTGSGRNLRVKMQPCKRKQSQQWFFKPRM